jgi:hypothetical protein
MQTIAACALADPEGAAGPPLADPRTQGKLVRVLRGQVRDGFRAASEAVSVLPKVVVDVRFATFKTLSRRAA